MLDSCGGAVCWSVLGVCWECVGCVGRVSERVLHCLTVCSRLLVCVGV